MAQWCRETVVGVVEQLFRKFALFGSALPPPFLLKFPPFSFFFFFYFNGFPSTFPILKENSAVLIFRHCYCKLNDPSFSSTNNAVLKSCLVCPACCVRRAPFFSFYESLLQLFYCSFNCIPHITKRKIMLPKLCFQPLWRHIFPLYSLHD